MICRQCGAEVDTRRRRSDGTVQCYNCRKIYYPKNSNQQMVRVQPQGKPKKTSVPSGIPWKRKYAKLPLWLWCVIVVLGIILIIPESDGPENADKVVQVPTVVSQEITLTTMPDGLLANTIVVEKREVEPIVQEPIKQENASLFPQTIFDSKGVVVTLTGFDRSALLGPEIKVVVENNSGMNLLLSLGELYCEGWQLAAYTASFDIADGSKAADTMYILSSTLDECGLKVDDMKNVIFKNAHIANMDDFMQGYDFDMNAILQR